IHFQFNWCPHSSRDDATWQSQGHDTNDLAFCKDGILVTTVMGAFFPLTSKARGILPTDPQCKGHSSL
ncbi:unnamed protein product, partial [Staurois parvus]